MFDINDLNLGNLNIEPPLYDEDCDIIEICESIGATYETCYKGCNMITSERCSKETKQNILLQYNAQKLAEQNAKVQDKENKKSAVRSWIQLILAALIGGIITKAFDILFSLIH